MWVSVLTCSRWTYKHGYSLHQQHQADGAGELLCPHNGHENLKLESPHHPIRHAKEDAEDHQAWVVAGLRERAIMKETTPLQWQHETKQLFIISH